MVWRDVAWRGMRRGVAWRGVAWHSIEVLGSLVIAVQVRERERERERDMTARWDTLCGMVC